MEMSGHHHRRKTFEEHLRYIWKVLESLKLANLKINSSKSNWFCREVRFLGHVISAEGESIDSEKISANANLNHPKDFHQFRSYLGLSI